MLTNAPHPRGCSQHAFTAPKQSPSPVQAAAGPDGGATRKKPSAAGTRGNDGLVTAGVEWQAATAQPVQPPRWDDITSPLSRAGRAFLNSRGIHDPVIAANDVRTATRSFRVESGWKTLECVAFPYKRDGDVVNVKYRSIEGVQHAAS